MVLGLLPQHLTGGGLAAQERSGEVDLQAALEILELEIDEGRVDADSGIVDQDVKPAMARDHGLERACDARRVAHVEMGGFGRMARLGILEEIRICLAS